MTGKGPSKLYWALSVALCLCTLVALWATAWKIRQQKVEARRGGREAEPSETDRPRRVSIARHGAARAGHFKLGYPREGALMVLTQTQQTLVTFTDVVPGERRAWQELQITCLAADPSAMLVEVEFKPGAPCRGVGDYLDLKPGLRIQLDDDLFFSVERWDPAKPEVFLAGSVSSGGLAEGGEFALPPYRAKLVQGVLRVRRD